MKRQIGLAVLLLGLATASTAFCEEPEKDALGDAERIRLSLVEQYKSLWERMSPGAKAGYYNLVGNVYLPADFDEQVLAKIDEQEHAWPLTDVSLRDKSRANTWMAYGIAPRPDDASKPLQYVVSHDQKYAMNCFACHGGNLYGATYPGAPNTTYALESLTDQVRKAKLP